MPIVNEYMYINSNVHHVNVSNHHSILCEKETHLIHIIYIQISGEGVSRFALYQLHYIIVMILLLMTLPLPRPLLGSIITAFCITQLFVPWRKGSGFQGCLSRGEGRALIKLFAQSFVLMVNSKFNKI